MQVRGQRVLAVGASVMAAALLASACGTAGSGGGNGGGSSNGGGSGNGGSSHGTHGTTHATARSAFLAAVSKRPPTEKLSMAIDLTGAQGIPGMSGFSMSGNGLFDNKDGLGDLTMNVGSVSGGTSIEVVIDDAHHNVYVKLPSGTSSAYGSKPWVSEPLESLGGSNPLGSSSFDPASMLSTLQHVATNVSVAGHATIDGVAATHYVILTTWAKVINADKNSGKHFPAPFAKQFKEYATLFGALGQLRYDVWVDSAGRVREMSFGLSIGKLLQDLLSGLGGSGAAGSSGQAEINRLQHVRMSFVLKFSGFGVPVHVTLPPASQVYRDSSGSVNPFSLAVGGNTV